MRLKYASLFTLLTLFFSFSISAQTACSELFISEYVEGGGNNKAIEIYNPSSSIVDLSNYGLIRYSNGSTNGTTISLSGMLDTGAVFVIANNQATGAFATEADMTSSNINFNGNDAVVLVKNSVPIDIFGEVGVDPGSYWTVGTSGQTQNRTLVRKSTVTSGTLSWAVSSMEWDEYPQDTDTYIGSHTSDNCAQGGGGGPVTPTILPLYPIGTIHGENALGEADSINLNCALQGIVTSIDFDGNTGVSFFIQDATGGINVFSFSDVDVNGSPYVVTAGDEIKVFGQIGQYRGLTQMEPDSMQVLSTGNALPALVPATSLGELNESYRVIFTSVTLVDASQWPSANASANVDITNGTDTITMRIDSDTDIDGTTVPTGALDIIGHVGQYDGTSAPFLTGYQLFPGSLSDITVATTVTVPNPYPLYPIATVHTEDAVGEADSAGTICSIQGVVTSMDFDQSGAGYSFFLEDATGAINVFNFSNVDVNGNPYSSAIGDELMLFGEIGQYRGLTQFEVDSIVVLSTGNPISAPMPATTLDESNESHKVMFTSVTLVDTSQWPTSSGSANVDFSTGSDTLTMRIDSDTDIDGTPAPIGSFDLIGHVNQFGNSSAPFLDGYQLLPGSLMDIIVSTTVTPSPSPYPLYSIGTIHTEDTDGVADSADVMCSVQGVVTSMDFDGNNGYSFYLEDMTGAINVFSFNDLDVNGSTYTVTIGDELQLFGQIGQYRGLTQMEPDSIAVLSTGNTIPAAIAASGMGEGNESKRVRFNNMSLVDPTQWSTTLTWSFDVDITDGTSVYSMRIDSDTDIHGTPVPTGNIDVIGHVNQYGNSSAPFLDGYQLLPGSLSDIMASVTVTPAGPCGDLFFSEYVEGTSNNKALEIYNPTANAVDLSDYTVKLLSNGGPSFNEHELSGILAAGDVYVIGNSSANLTEILNADTLLGWPSVVTFNGNDAVMLIKDSTIVLDVIGDPDTSYNYTVPGGALKEYTLVRNNTVNEGTTDWSVGQNQWTVHPQNTTTYLDAHTMIPCGSANPIVGFTTLSQSVLEDAGTVTVDLSILNGDVNATTVQVGVSTLTTAQLADYSFTWTTVTFPGGSSVNQQVTVDITDDMDAESTEEVVLFVFNPSNGATIGNLNHSISILDNDQIIPVYNIGDVDGVDADGVADSLDVVCKLQGIVSTINYRPTGLQMGLQDATGGITVFSFNPMGTYMPAMGDEIRVTGELGQFNGLLQIYPDSIFVLSTGNPLPTPAVVTSIGEAEESVIIRINNLSLVDPSQWGSGSSGFNVDVTDGTNTYQMRVDADCPVYSMPAPGGTFDVIGWGQQYDSSNPYTDGYQFFPRTMADIIGGTIIIPNIYLNEIQTENSSTVMDDHGDYDAWIEFYTTEATGVDLGGYYLSDDANNLTKYQIPTGQFGTTVPANGYLLGWLDGEDSEGSLHTSFDLNGSTSGSLYLTAGDGTTVVDTIDYSSLGMDLSFGAQTDGSNTMVAFPNGPTPLASNATSSINELNASLVNLYPNPTTNSLNIEVENTQMDVHIEVLDLAGRTITSDRFFGKIELNTANWTKGSYIIRLSSESGMNTFRVIKI